MSDQPADTAIETLVEHLIQDAMSVLHHDGCDDGETPEDTYNYTMLRRKFRDRLTPADATASQVTALQAEVERHAANYREVVGLRCELQERFDQLAARATSAEAEVSRLREALGEIERRAMSVCEQHHANADEHAARQAYALALHDIATLARTAGQKEKDNG